MKKIFMAALLTVVLTGWAAAGPTLEKRLEDLNQKVAEVKIDQEQLEKGASDEIQKKVDRIMSLYRSPEYQQKLKQEQARIRENLGIEGQTEEGGGGDVGSGQLGRPVYIFASSSVPLQTLRNYTAGMMGLEGYRPVMVFRGFVGGAGKIGSTVRLIGDIIKVDSGCDMTSGQCDTWPVSVTVDPMKFRRFGIEKVPAIVLDRGAKSDPLTIYGDVSLEYAIRQFEAENKTGT